MCGHFGFILSKEDRKNPSFIKSATDFFNSALLCGSLRGTDGTGVLTISATHTYTLKTKAPGYNYRDLDGYKSMANCKGMVAMLGHNRKKTYGVNSDENAHPFKYGEIVLFHNGTLNNSHQLKDKYKVDSESIADALSTSSAKDVLENIDGSFSLVWYDGAEDAVYFARNSERPMFMGRTKGGSIFYASELGMLEWLAHRHHVYFESTVKTDEDTIIKVSTGNDYTTEISKFKSKDSCDIFGYGYYLRSYRGGKKESSDKAVHLNSVIELGKQPSDAHENCSYCLCEDAKGRYHLVDGEVLCGMCVKLFEQ